MMPHDYTQPHEEIRNMLHPILNVAVQAVRQSSRAILRYLDQLDRVRVTEKAPNDFVTQVDELSQEIIIETIQKSYPQHAIIAEETNALQTRESEYTWVIDPIDGTTNFIRGLPHFCISIGIMKKDQVEFGVIYDPVRQELFTATRGQGAFVNSRRMRVSNTKKLSESVLATGFPNQINESTQKMLGAFLTGCMDMRATGSAALDLAYVAAGRLDGYWESGLQIWDIAAGALMVQESGGKITDFRGENQYLQNGNVLATNFKLHAEMLTLTSM